MFDNSDEEKELNDTTGERVLICHICRVDGHHADECEVPAMLRTEFKAWQEFERDGKKTKVAKFNSLILRCCQIQDLDGAIYLFREMASCPDRAPNAKTFEALGRLNGSLKKEHVERKERIVVPTVEWPTTLFSGQTVHNARDMLRAVVKGAKFGKKASAADSKTPQVVQWLRTHREAAEKSKNCFKLASLVSKQCKISKAEAQGVVIGLKKSKRIKEVKKAKGENGPQVAHVKLFLDDAAAGAGGAGGAGGADGADGEAKKKTKAKKKTGKKRKQEEEGNGAAAAAAAAVCGEAGGDGGDEKEAKKKKKKKAKKTKKKAQEEDG